MKLLGLQMIELRLKQVGVTGHHTSLTHLWARIRGRQRAQRTRVHRSTKCKRVDRRRRGVVTL